MRNTIFSFSLSLAFRIAVLLSPGMAEATELQRPAQAASYSEQIEPTVESDGDALAEDAVEYASQFGVSHEEAMHRLAAQEASVPVTDALAERYRDRLAGIAIEHRPSYRIVVNLTGMKPVAAERMVLNGQTTPIVFRTGALVTRDRVIWAMTNHQAAIRSALTRPSGMGLDPRSGELVVIISKAEASEGVNAVKAKLEAIAGVPVQVRVLDRIDKNLSVEGGSRLESMGAANNRRYMCTSGFVVTDGVRDGVATAAHCADTMTYYDPQHNPTPLTFVGQWGWGYRDVQINAAPYALPPLFYADSARTRSRPVNSQRTHAATRAGDFVCHRGEATGYSCALVELTDFAPAGDLCGGACLPTWVTISGPKCKAGDSGSPVFSGTTAFGLVKGASYRPDGSCAFYFYMPIDYLPSGWTLRRATLSPSSTRVLPPISAAKIN
ncbi:S1 family peptidase [Sphingomonas sp.]|uniref:S1 family peptidase n=1 Tax=Sphingomonas sp. TaxID=28214 RepID=UPI0025D808A5|nr:S1 family peptidase [Sphingomonas sp.]